MGQVRDEGIARPPADARAATKVKQGQVGETFQVGETAVCQLAAACRRRRGRRTERIVSKMSQQIRLLVLHRRTDWHKAAKTELGTHLPT